MSEGPIRNFDPRRGSLRNLVVFDLETTGLSPQDDEIIQIAALRIVDGEIAAGEDFFSYVKPRRRIDPFITGFTGITDRDVHEAPGPVEVLARFSRYCGDALLVAHNGHTFDVPFLRRACDRRRCSVRQVSYIDSLHLSWGVWGRARGVSHALDRVVSRLRVATEGIRRHDARGDVALLSRCVVKLLDRLERSADEHSVNVYPCVLPAVKTL
jgi:DNA polymerase III epsilon subunit family exonuclease